MTWFVSFYRSTIGKKFVMAVTGIVLFAWLIGHLLGNLQIYLGREKVNHYSAFLHGNPGLLWTARFVTLLCLYFHMDSAFRLAIRKRRSRPQGYRRPGWVQLDYASRTMMISGPLVAVYVVYHLLDLTWGTLHPRFDEADVYGNMIGGFSNPLISAVYIVAMVLLGLHLYHGVWSFFQTMGLSHPRYNHARRVFSTVVTVVIAGGFISIPLAVLAGVVS